MIDLLIAFMAMESRVSVECKGRPLSAVVALLQEQVTERLEVAANLRDIPVVAYLKDARWETVKVQFERAAWAKWTRASDGTLTLTRGKPEQALIELSIQRDRQALYQPHLRLLKKQAQGQVDVDVNSHTDFETLVSQTVVRFLADLGNEILSAAGGVIWNHPAAKGEVAVPSSAKLALQRLFDLDARRLQQIESKSFPLSQVALIFDGDGLGTIYFADRTGLVKARRRFGIGESSLETQPLANFATTALIEFPQRSKDYLALFASGEAKHLSTQTRGLLDDPVTTDPVEIVLGEALTQIAKRNHWQLVAFPGWISSSIVSRQRTPMSERTFLAALSRHNLLELEQSTVVIRPRPQYLVSQMSRAELKAVMTRIRLAESSEAVARTIADTIGKKSGSPLEFLNYIQPITGKVIAGGTATIHQPPLWQKLLDTRAPFKSVVRLTLREQQELLEFAQLCPETIVLRRRVKVEGEGGEMAEALLGVGDTLDALPSRALSPRVGGEILIDWRPGSSSNYVRSGPTDQYADSRLAEQGPDGQVSPKGNWTWMYGAAGGGVVFSLGDGVEVRTGFRVWAANRNDKANRVGSLMLSDDPTPH